MTTSNKRGPDGLWQACSNMEIVATKTLAKQLELYESPICQCYEAGVQVATLNAKRHKESDISIAALFLKKALNDLRSVWILLHQGYTSQAASVSASLFENALVVTAIAGNEINSQKINKSKSGDLPWSPQQLAKILAQQLKEEAKVTGEKFDDKDYEIAWREIYSGYKWLCKIKHPTISSAIHDASSTSLKSEEFVIMAAPDLRAEDLAIKATILSISISRVYSAIRSFSFGLECDTTDLGYKNFIKRMQGIPTGVVKAYKELVKAPLPLEIGDSELSKEWTRLKSSHKDK